MSASARGRYGVKSATLTVNSTTYSMKSGPAGKSVSCDAVDVTALTDSVKQFIKGTLSEEKEFTVTLYQQGTGDLTVATAGACSIAVTLSNGVDSDATVSVSYNKVLVTDVSYPNQDASGDRAATYDVTLKPDGTVAAG